MQGALTGVAQWIECQPANLNITGLMHMPGLCARSPVGGMWEATNRYLSHTSVFLSISFSLHSLLNK